MVDWLTPESEVIDRDVAPTELLSDSSEQRTICVYKNERKLKMTKHALVEVVYHKYLGKISKSLLKKRTKMDLERLASSSQ